MVRMIFMVAGKIAPANGCVTDKFLLYTILILPFTPQITPSNWVRFGKRTQFKTSVSSVLSRYHFDGYSRNIPKINWVRLVETYIGLITRNSPGEGGHNSGLRSNLTKAALLSKNRM